VAPRRIQATARGHVAGVACDDVFAFLADLRNHWRLAGRLVSVDELDGGDRPQGAWVRLHGPLGLGRVAHTRIVRTSAPADGVGAVLEGAAAGTNGTSASIVWSLAASPRGTSVTLELAVERATVGDRLLLVLGGRRWLERRLLRAAVAGLAGELRSAQRR